MALEHVISKNVKVARQERGMSQRRLSEVTGIDVRQICKLENRPGPLTTTTIERLCQALQLSPADLLSGALKAPKSKKLSKSFERGLKEAIKVLKIHLNNIE